MSRRTLSLLCAVALVAGSIALATPGGAGSTADIAFRAQRDGNAEIYLTTQDGRTQTDLSNSPTSQDDDPAWSPDGDSVAFARHQRPLGGTHILVMKSGGCCAHKLTSLQTATDRQPAWSPDGTKISFTRGDEDHGSFQIWVIGADGSNLHAVTGITEHVFNGSPAWSPDGSRIAFVSDRAGGFPKIFEMNSDGSFAHRVSTGTWADGNPAWSPDGSLLAFDRCCQGGHSSIYLMPATGGALTRVTDDSIEASDPTWSPDGTTLAFVGFPPGGGNRDIYTINVDGTNLVQVTDDPWSDLSPAWSPAAAIPPPTAALTTGLGDVIAGVPGAEETAHREPAREDPSDERAAAASVDPATRKHHKHRHKKKHRKPITRKTVHLAPGLTLTRVVNRKIPQRIFVVKAHVMTTRLRMDVALATDELPGFETVRSMAGRHHALVAVNGDFGLSSGRPMGIYAEDGDLKQTLFGWGNNVSVSRDEKREYLGHAIEKVTATVSDTGESWPVRRVNEGVRPVFGEITEYTKAGGALLHPPTNSCGAHLVPDAPGHFEATSTERAIVRDFTVDRAGCFAAAMPLNGGVVLSGYPTDPESLLVRALVPGEGVSLKWSLGWHQSADALGGFPRLLRDGEIVPSGKCDTSFCGRNPRTAVGFTADGTMLMVVVDGRYQRYSRGATLTGLARIMRRFGAVDAMNLDGGGSSTMVVKGTVVNRPSDPGGPRHVSSALLIVDGADRGEAFLDQSAAPKASESSSILSILPGTGSVARAWRLAATDPGSTGGLVESLAAGELGPRGFRLTPLLAAALRLYRGG
ncbi:MAG: phosphodiester glycosidase family protein [Actinomycetota bacterium]